ncbi:hypothetical protein [Prevotella pallens]|uniref:hypothetical protein n=1 Tax=Prevotella pallens TaxID=60133 RepID=UPI0023F3D518|nr:hypothetical protein [Prevotella pallens]
MMKKVITLLLILFPTYTFAKGGFTLIKVLDGLFRLNEERIIVKNAEYKVVNPDISTTFDCIPIEVDELFCTSHTEKDFRIQVYNANLDCVFDKTFTPKIPNDYKISSTYTNRFLLENNECLHLIQVISTTKEVGEEGYVKLYLCNSNCSIMEELCSSPNFLIPLHLYIANNEIRLVVWDYGNSRTLIYRFYDDKNTNIENIKARMSKLKGTFNLQGIPVPEDEKGLVIRNGVKILNK